MSCAKNFAVDAEVMKHDFCSKVRTASVARKLSADHEREALPHLHAFASHRNIVF